MAPKRDYAAEYARRSKERIAETRGARASAFGFETYGQYRASADKIKGEFQSLARRDIWDFPPPVEGSPLWNSMMNADALLKSYTPEQRRRAADRKESILGRSAKGRAIRDDLRDLLGWKSERGWGAVYFPVMRLLY